MPPWSFKNFAKDAAHKTFPRPLRRLVPDLAPSLMQFALYWPHDHKAGTYARPVRFAGQLETPADQLPVPPPNLWAHYCTTTDSWLRSGQEDTETMRKLLAASGAPIEDAGRILDMGCAAGRMIRHLADLTQQVQVWGTDMWTDPILWCQDHLSPPFYFTVNTVVPHLPFEDRSFGLVYCGSLFTHIDDLVEAWFLELHRIIRPGGRLYFSVNDRHSIDIFDGKGDPGSYERFWERTSGKHEWDQYVISYAQLPGYRRLRDGDAYMVTKGRSMRAQVMWDTDVLCQRLDYGWRPCSVTPEGYGHQTTVLLERL
jgi:SAM-dependent methyltransferase